MIDLVTLPSLASTPTIGIKPAMIPHDLNLGAISFQIIGCSVTPSKGSVIDRFT
jgi:hypothetical protein